MQPTPQPEALSQAAPARIALDASRLLGGLPLAGAGQVMVGSKPTPATPPPPVTIDRED